MGEYLQRAGAQVAVVSQPTDTLVLPGGAVYNINQHRGIALVDEPAGLVRIPPQNGALWNTRNFSIK